MSLCFCFFKQKTAYEMRISDWSSDVCSSDLDVRAVDWLPDGQGGSLVTAQVQDSLLCFTIAQAGAHWVANALAVLAAVKAVGGDLPAAGLAFAEMGGLVGRGARHRVAVPGGQILVIDESYNANPASMAATIGQLGTESAGRKVAVLGAMKELDRKRTRLNSSHQCASR